MAPIAGVVLVFRDVTENRRADDALRETQAKLLAAMASMTDSVIITDAEGRFVDFNDAFATFYRFKSKAECAKSFDEFANLFDVFLANVRTGATGDVCNPAGAAGRDSDECRIYPAAQRHR
jgi:PAS domain-containing protein